MKRLLFLALAAGVSTAEDPFNCRTREMWTKEKTVWCCANKRMGCPIEQSTKMATQQPEYTFTSEPEPHNCKSRERWSPEKVAYCCKMHKLGCPVDIDELEPAPEGSGSPRYCHSREKWSKEKTRWCCANQNLGCPPPEKPMVKKADTHPAEEVQAEVQDIPLPKSTTRANKQPNPQGPRMISVHHSTADAATLVWVAPGGDTDCAVVSYEVHYRLFGIKNAPWQPVLRPNPSEPMHVITGLTADTLYQVRVKARSGGLVSKPAFRRFKTRKVQVAEGGGK
jgi:hypothetical protein